VTGPIRTFARAVRVLFSDRVRPAGLLAALALLAGLSVYAARVTYWQCASPGDCLDHSGRCDGRKFVAGAVRIAVVTPAGFTVLSSRGPLFFEGRFPELVPGCYADIEAVFHAPDRFEALAVHGHLERSFKIWGSLAAAMIVAGLFLRVLWRKEF
jgi:hypothetical protein